VLQALMPRRATEEEIQALVAKRSKRSAAEWAGKSPAEREALIAVTIREQSAALGIPPPELVLDGAIERNASALTPARWTIKLNPHWFREEATEEMLAKLRALIRHEVQHALQEVEAGRYAVFHAGDPAYVNKLPPDVRSAIASRGPFPPDSDELARGRKWYEEWGPGIGDWRKVMDAYHATRKALSEARADHRSLHAHCAGGPMLIVAGGATVVAGASYAGYELAHVR
jgi:hypothetical protein